MLRLKLIHVSKRGPKSLSEAMLINPDLNTLLDAHQALPFTNMV